MIKIWAAEAKIRQLFIQKHWILHFPWCNFITPSLIPFLPGWYSHLHTSVYTFCNCPFVVSSAKLNPDDIIFTSSRGFFSSSRVREDTCQSHIHVCGYLETFSHHDEAMKRLNTQHASVVLGRLLGAQQRDAGEGSDRLKGHREGAAGLCCTEVGPLPTVNRAHLDRGTWRNY